MNFLSYVFIIVAILLLLYFCVSEEVKDQLFKSPDKLINESIGVFDKKAALALNKLSAKQNKTANDKLKIGNIISHNLLELETPIKGPRAAMTKTAASHYTNALQNPAPDIDAHLLDTAENFNRNLADTLARQVDLFPGGDENERGPMNFGGRFEMPQYFDEFDVIIGNLGDGIDLARQTQAAAVKQYADASSKTVDEATTKYLEASKKNTSDPQNSHNPGVSREIRHTLDIIEPEIDDPRTADDICNEINEFIRRADITEKKKQKAKYSLSVIKNKNAEISAANRSELKTIRLVWLRAEHPDNAENAENIKLGVLDALIDITANNGYAEQSEVCANGRLARVVGSLSSLDFNENVGRLQTKEQINNYILEQSATLWKKYLAENPGPIADSFVNGTDTPEGPELDAFNMGLKNKVDQMLIENSAEADIRNKVYIGFNLL